MMKQLCTGVLLSTFIILWGIPATAFEVTPVADANLLADTLRGEGIMVLPDTIVYQGTPSAIGMFSADDSSGLGLASGIIIRSDPPAGDNLSEPNILEFDFTTATNDLFCRYVLASEEYDEYGGSPAYPDLLILYVDGEQAALLPDHVTSAAINLVNAGQNWDYFQNNTSPQPNLPYSGFTKVLTAMAADLDPERASHHFKLLVMNQGDRAKQSALLLEQGSCRAYGLRVEDVEADEDAGVMNFTVNLSKSAPTVVSFAYHTDDDTAIADSDYSAVSGTSGITPGGQSVEIAVNIDDDALAEEDETFFIKLSNVTNATLISPDGIGTIRDNEGLPVLAITDATAEEVTLYMTFTVSLSVTSTQDVSVDYSMVDDTAIAGFDYNSTQGTLVIPAGENFATIEVDITLDEIRDEEDELFFVALSNPINAVLDNPQGTGTIQNTPGGLLNRMLGRPIPEPSTYILYLLGLFGLGWFRRRRKW